jgi:uridine phosphorylase
VELLLKESVEARIPRLQAREIQRATYAGKKWIGVYMSIVNWFLCGRSILMILLLGSGSLSGEENRWQDKPHLTPDKLLSQAFPREAFRDIRVAVVGYCPPAAILQKYNPVNLTDQYFFLVPSQCVQVCTYNGIKFLSISHIYGGSPSSALIEDLAYYGIEYILAYGFAGGLKVDGVKCGDLYLVESSLVRDGTTPHYTKEDVVYPNALLNQQILDLAQKKSSLGDIHLLKAMTDDAIYQEYESDLDEAVAHGCDIVNLDCAHLFAVSKYVGIAATQFGIVSNARENAGEEKADDLAKTLINQESSVQNPLIRVNDIVQFYVETVLPKL